MTDAVGAHFFHRWKGYRGTAAAFTSGYRGGEPLTAPHLPLAPTAPPTPAIPAVTLAAAPTVRAAVTPPAEARPEHADSGTALATAPESQVLDRWKDSGKPLR